MATLRPYKKYNSVAYDYATELPDGWQLLPNIAIFQERIERGYEIEELLSVTIGRGVIKQSDLDKKDSSTLDKSKYLLVYPDDLVYSMRFRQGASGYSNYKGIVSPACTVLKPRKGVKFNPRYYHYMLRTGFYKNYAERYAYGIADGQMPLRYFDFKRMYSIVPPLEVQNSIVAYLDKKNSEIDKFIRNKEMLLELLEESRKRKIFDAITKGIDKDVDLKESGLPWIGIIPKHWELKKVKSFASHVQRGSSPTYVNESELVVISQASMSSGFIDETKYKYQSKAKIENFKGRLFEDDVLLASTGGGVLGKSIVFDRDGNYIADGHLTIIRDKKKRFNSKFLFYFLSINFDFIEGYLGQGSTNQTELQRGWFRDLYLPFPYLKEQDRIVEFVNDFNDEINLAISKAQKEISSIKEYREALITDLVTGKRSLNCDLE
jgi:type I restriction enzyme S subunit